MSVISQATNPFGFFDGITKGVGDFVNGLFGGNNTATKAPAPAPTPAPKPTTTNPLGSGDYAAQTQALNQQIAALTAKINAQPKLAQYDILGNYNNAKAQATANVTPLYDQKLQQFLNAQATATANKQASANLGYENNTLAQNNTLTDNGTSRVRTGQDLANTLAAIATSRGQFQQDDGNAFDVARRGLLETTAANGATDTGLGQQAVADQLTARNLNSGRQEQAFKDQEAAKSLLAGRTFEDLATSDTRAGEQKTQADKSVKLDLDSYLSTLANDTEQEKLNLNIAKAGDIAAQTGQLSKQAAQKFIASLSGKGYSAADIALASQVYGAG